MSSCRWTTRATIRASRQKRASCNSTSQMFRVLAEGTVPQRATKSISIISSLIDSHLDGHSVLLSEVFDHQLKRTTKPIRSLRPLRLQITPKAKHQTVNSNKDSTSFKSKKPTCSKIVLTRSRSISRRCSKSRTKKMVMLTRAIR